MAFALPPGLDLSKIPAGVNPNGDPPNFINPPNNEDLVLGVGLPLVSIAFILVVLRVSTNLKIAGKLHADDYLCVLSLLTAVPYFALAVSFRDTARHPWDVPLSLLDESYFKRVFAFNVLSGPMSAFSKLSIIFLYLRIFNPKPWFRWCCYGMMVLTLAYWANVPLSAALCTPRHGKWDFSIGQTCTKLAVTSLIHGSVSIFSTCAIIASAISMYYRARIYLITDKFWDSPKVSACAVVEVSVTIIVSCAPVVLSYWNNFFTKSAFYSKLSSFRTSMTRSTIATKDTPGTTKGNSMTASSVSQSKLVSGNSEYYELKDVEFGKPQTYVRSGDSQPSEASLTDSRYIKKSMTVSQHYD